MPKVSTIIPSTKGGFSHIAELMPLLAKEMDNEVIVIDNASRDGTSHYLSNYECIIKINKENKGFSIANNQGAKLSQSDYLLFLNNDTKIEPGFIAKMLSTFSKDSDIGIVGCQIKRMESGLVQHAGVCFTSDYVPYELGLDQSGISQALAVGDMRINSIRPVPSVTAACMMIPHSLFEQVGGFDEGYINGWEDTDLVLRVRELGYVVWYNGTAIVHHRHFGSKDAGRFTYESQNRARYDTIWKDTGRAQKILGEFREG